MRVLLLDDNEMRTQDIEEIIHNYGEELITSHSLEDAEYKLKHTKYDLVIIDLVVPILYNDRNLVEEAGLELIKCIYEEMDSVYAPKGVIVVSERLHDLNYIEELKLYPVSIINTKDINWKSKLNTVIDVFWNKVNPIDLAIITAVDTEFHALYDDTWTKDIDSGSISFYRKLFHTKNDHDVTAILFQSEDKGMVPACMAMSKLFKHYIPKRVVMVGIAAGNPYKTKFGDIIVATKSCDYSSGAIKDTDAGLSFEAEPQQIQISDNLINVFKRYSRDAILPFQLRRKVNMPQYTEDIKILPGLMACGPLVVKSKRITDKFILPYNKNYFGIDMETYAVYYMCKKNQYSEFISIKSVSDHGDVNKTHEHQVYCARLSTELLLHYIREEM